MLKVDGCTLDNLLGQDTTVSFELGPGIVMIRCFVKSKGIRISVNFVERETLRVVRVLQQVKPQAAIF